MAQNTPVDTHFGVIVRADEVEDIGNGRFRIVVRSRQMSEQEIAVFERLFPNLGNAAHRLLAQEAMLEAVE